MNNFKEISRICYILNFALVPFIVFPYSFSPTTLFKTFTLVSLTTTSFIFYILSKPKKPNLPNSLLLLLILVEFISNYYNFNLSLFPRYSEHIYISVMIYINIFLGINLFEKLKLEKIILYTSPLVVISSSIDIIILGNRAQGTLGQSNFLGIYLTILLLIIVSSFQHLEKINKYFRYFYVILIIILFIKTASLASIFGLILGLYFFKEKILNIRKKFLVISSLIIISILFFYGSILSFKFQDLYYQIFDQKNTKISDSFLIRKVIWNKTIEIILDNPYKILFGFGPNNFSQYFENQRGKSLKGYSEEILLFDKPHNYYVEILFSYGLIYLILFLSSVYISYQKNISNRYMLVPILFFIFFNWLDVYLKIILFNIVFLNLEKSSISSDLKIKFIMLISSIIVLIQFSILTYNDINYYFGDKKFYYSYIAEDIINLKIKDPIILVSFLKDNFSNLEEGDRKKIFDYLIKNFPENQAILFHLDELL